MPVPSARSNLPIATFIKKPAWRFVYAKLEETAVYLNKRTARKPNCTRFIRDLLSESEGKDEIRGDVVSSGSPGNTLSQFLFPRSGKKARLLTRTKYQWPFIIVSFKCFTAVRLSGGTYGVRDTRSHRPFKMLQGVQYIRQRSCSEPVEIVFIPSLSPAQPPAMNS